VTKSFRLKVLKVEYGPDGYFHKYSEATLNKSSYIKEETLFSLGLKASCSALTGGLRERLQKRTKVK
jgi:hypothetical protein